MGGGGVKKVQKTIHMVYGCSPSYYNLVNFITSRLANFDNQFHIVFLKSQNSLTLAKKFSNEIHCLKNVYVVF